MAVADRAYRHLYVHVPFCARRCSYCDFSIAVRRVVPVHDYVDAVARELRLRRASETCDVLDTVYFGGGTPSRLGADGIRALLDVMREEVAMASDAEVTMEANPEDITDASVAAWRASGINRLSIGIQSFDDRVLRWMHRTHDATTARRAVATARQGGIDAFSLDLIFAVPDSLERDWQRDVDDMLQLEPEHVSLYGLTVEPHTPLGRWHSRGDVNESSEERYETEFRLAHTQLTAAGFEHYEVSNFARPARRARHNSAYWKGVPYLGVGPSAHGFDGTSRRWNLSAYATWRPAVIGGVDPIDGTERLTPENRSAETVYLGLRTRDGLVVAPSEVEHTARWQAAGWVEYSRDGAETRLRCTAEGWLRLDALAADLTALRSRS
jgi:oxygen-independent coproporphyrinogen-3 oxidase